LITRIRPSRVVSQTVSAGADDLLAVQHAVGPDVRPVLAGPELLGALHRPAAALLDQPHEHPGALGLHDQSDGLLVVRVEVPVHRVGVHQDEVVLLPLVALVVVDLVTGALEDVEGSLVLVTVPVVGAARRQFHEVHLKSLGQELLVTGADAPPGPGLLRVPGVPDLAVVDDDRVVPHPVDSQLSLPELAQTVGLAGQTADEHASLLTHQLLTFSGHCGRDSGWTA